MSKTVDEKMSSTHPLTNSYTHLLKVNEMLVEKLIAFVERLKETKGMRISKRGLEKAVELLKKCEERVFTWAPQVKDWLKDPDYIFWLGRAR